MRVSFCDECQQGHTTDDVLCPECLEMLEFMYSSEGHPLDPDNYPITRLRQTMAAAIEREDYELAAACRDDLHDLCHPFTEESQ